MESYYGGCWSEVEISSAQIRTKCDWPRPELGYMCSNGIVSILKAKQDSGLIRKRDNEQMYKRHQTNLIPETTSYDKLGVPIVKNYGYWRNVSALNIIRRLGPNENHPVAESDHQKLINTNLALEYLEKPYNTRNAVDPFNIEWGQGGVKGDEHLNVCSREQCVDNGSTDYSELFLIAEWVFAVWFVVEIFLRIFSARSLKTYFMTISNIFDIGAVCISIGEVVAIPILIGESGYEVWGSGTDPGMMRFLRILVTIRFITMQRHFSGLKVISMTVKKVAGKMKIPIFFFFIFAVVFASIFYVFESGNLFTEDGCKAGDPYPKRPIDVLTENTYVVDDWIKSTGASVPEHGTLDWHNMGMNWYYSREGECRFCPEEKFDIFNFRLNYSAISKYNSTCRSWVKATSEGGEVLAEPKVEDMVDAIWCMIVTMTTVGYGVYYPTQVGGKATSLVAALFGSFYMAMPLTIVGTDFYDIYQDVQSEDEDMKKKINKIFKKTDKKNDIKVDGQFSVAQISKLKLKGLAAKDRVREMGLHKDEIQKAFDYIEAVEAVSQFFNI